MKNRVVKMLMQRQEQGFLAAGLAALNAGSGAQAVGYAALLAMIGTGRRARARPGQGACKVGADSSLRKRMRHLAREGGPAVEVQNPERYLHAHARRRLAA